MNCRLLLNPNTFFQMFPNASFSPSEAEKYIEAISEYVQQEFLGFGLLGEPFTQVLRNFRGDYAYIERRPFDTSTLIVEYGDKNNKTTLVEDDDYYLDGYKVIFTKPLVLQFRNLYLTYNYGFTQEDIDDGKIGSRYNEYFSMAVMTYGKNAKGFDNEGNQKLSEQDLSGYKLDDESWNRNMTDDGIIYKGVYGQDIANYEWKDFVIEIFNKYRSKF